MLKSYLKDILHIASRGDAREESYYTSLKSLIDDFAKSIHKEEIHVTILPKKTEAGNPDFRIWQGMQKVIGYIEAKNPQENLDDIVENEQIKRYLDGYSNFILTNFLNFQLYRQGKKIDAVQIARPFIYELAGGLKTPPAEKEKEFLSLLNKFFAFSSPKIYTAEALALELAKRTRLLKEQVIIEELKEEDSPINGFYDAFKKYLITDLTKEHFADLYSQTITYGLFIARTRTEGEFHRKLAFEKIPHAIGILRDIFQFISLGELSPHLQASVDDISEVLSATNVKEIFHKDYIEGKDPIVYFYEPFLKEYDHTIQETRGAYYTPIPVVSYIVRSINIILKEHFDGKEGLADTTVTVLDPAAGTLTFLADATKLAVKEFVAKYGEGGKHDFIKEHILKNFYAFELMMAPYAVGHLKMSLLLDELGYKLEKDERFKFYLTNTLEMEEKEQITIPGVASLAQESHDAGEVKKKTPILVILGNPPYSGISANMRSEWIKGLIEDYKYIDGKHFGEKKHWLQDDYVKFIRFAQWKIEQAGEGVLGFITNHSWLDNPTFRGMRQSLMNSFNEIYILDLHGSSLKREKCPDGSKDENVFDIRQGVAISLFIKKKNVGAGLVELAKSRFVGAPVQNINKATARVAPTKVSHSEMWGLREYKYSKLLENDIKSTKWKELKPKSPYYFFIPREEVYEEIYNKYWKVTDIFPVNSVGFVTARDSFVIDFDRNALKSRFLQFYNTSLSMEWIKNTFRIRDYRNFKIEKIRKEREFNASSIIKCLYRPFDERYIYYEQYIVQEWQFKVMRHMMQENLGLCAGRAGHVVGLEKPWNIVFCSNCIEDLNLFYRGGNVNFPIYLYPGASKEELFTSLKSGNRKPNLNPELVNKLNEHYVGAGLAPAQNINRATARVAPTAEEIFYYIYGVLYSNIYRLKYAEFLKIDFPRVPFTKDYELFIKMGEYGKRLVDLHLMNSNELSAPIAKFQGSGNNQVDKVKYDEKKVYINKEQYFEGIEKEVWEYQIGGYQVLSKWLKDRKDCSLSLDDIKYYCKIVTALKETSEIQKEIDNLYPKVEKELIESD